MSQSTPQPVANVGTEFERAPAFQVRRFKKNLGIDCNEPFAGELLTLLGFVNNTGGLPPCLHSFMVKLDNRLNDGYQTGVRQTG